MSGLTDYGYRCFLKEHLVAVVLRAYEMCLPNGFPHAEGSDALCRLIGVCNFPIGFSPVPKKFVKDCDPVLKHPGKSKVKYKTCAMMDMHDKEPGYVKFRMFSKLLPGPRRD